MKKIVFTLLAVAAVTYYSCGSSAESTLQTASNARTAYINSL